MGDGWWTGVAGGARREAGGGRRVVHTSTIGGVDAVTEVNPLSEATSCEIVSLGMYLIMCW